ncbi:MAG: hypothetical protein ACI4KI_04290 [Candidatus Fimenecus sp.]
MKKICFLLCAVFILLGLSGCKKSDPDYIQPLTEATVSVSETDNASRSDDTVSSEPSSVNSSTQIAENTTKPSSTAQPTTTLSALENVQNSDVVTYYSENPNNRYICIVANQYGVDKSNLVALIRTQAQNPGATVLEFSGKKDANGQLIKNKNELKSVFEISDSDGTIRKATGKMSGNVGYNYAESLAAFELTKEFIIPQLDQMKEERTYPE